MNSRLQEKLKSLPDKPGVYLFKDGSGKILYVGKAVSLKKRVSSYFQQGRPQPVKVLRLVEEIEDLEWVQTGSEAEALLYEAGMIKEARPKYNISLRDDKSYPYLKITVDEKFPRLFIGRGQDEPGVKRIGPFTNAALLRQAFNAVRRIIPFRTCRTLPQRACLDYHLKLCSAPCEGKISEQEYQENLSKVLRLMEGKKEEVLKEMQGRMKEAAQQRRYEEAAKLRDQIAGLQQMTVHRRQVVPAQALADLQSVLRLPLLPRRIEGFDISNVYGKEAVGSLVTFVDGRPFKEGYKRFKIKTVAGIDDYAMMREVIRRRFTDLQKEKGLLPDLVVIDGGKGHLNAGMEVFKELGIHPPVIGIAKEFEEIFLPGRTEPVLLPPQSKALQIVQRVRDEAHRFAIGYHRLLRGKRTLASALDKIAGVGPRRKQDLLVRFGSVEGMRSAAVSDFTQVRGISRMLAERIVRELKKNS
ncbi:MAG: excinuclease ABC subunit UvrC [Candidatus Omnitrophica bacterium]|nr:excinuclease ABC subunit UvrC [Candidatus Omnitrophota bacterium]